MINIEELTRRLLATSTTQFVGLVAVHEPEMPVKRRTNPYRDKVIKLSRANGAINWRYASSVNKQRKREDKPADFKSDPRTWGNRVNSTPLVIWLMDGVQFYLELKRQNIERWYFHSETLEPIEESELLPYFPKTIKSRRQKLEREVILRDYRLDHIAELTIGGQTWQIEPVWWKLKALRQSLQLKQKATT